MKPTSCGPILAALTADTDPLGMSHAALVAATGLSPVHVSRALSFLLRALRIGRLGAYKDSRYFASPERAEQCGGEFDAHMAKVLIERHASYRERQNIKERKRYAANHPGCTPTGPKPRTGRRVIVRQPALKAPVEIKKPREDRQVIVPAHVRVQVCPCGKDQRYSVPADHVGEFLREWKQLRAKPVSSTA